MNEFNSPVKKALDTTVNSDSDKKMEEEISSDYDILDNIESIYFTEDFCPSRLELEVCTDYRIFLFYNLSICIYVNIFFFTEIEWNSADGPNWK